MKDCKFGMTLILILFSILFFACENSVDAAYDDFIDETKTSAASQKSYIVFNIVQPGRTATRTITSEITTSLFSDITFSGRRSDGLSLSPVTASNFAQLSSRTIEVEAGQWNFTLTAWLGKTSTSPGGMYKAEKALSVVPGDNELVMTLSPAPEDTSDPDPVNQYLLADHPGSWKVSLSFPYEKIDKIKFYLMPYSTYITEAVPSSSLLHQFVKGSDYTSGSINIAESSLQMGSYVIYIEYFTNLLQQNGPDTTTVQEMKLNNWAELLRISPGALSEGTITLPEADNVYSIHYELGGSSYSWVTSPTEAIPLSYTRNSGTSGVITLPTEISLDPTDPNCTFEGWYTSREIDPSDPNKYIYNGHVTTFNVSDAENKTFYAKWHEPVYDVYISADGNDITGDGSPNNPLKTAKAAYELFDILDSDQNTIHIKSDYIGLNTISEPWGDGSKTGMHVKFVGENGGVENSPVTLNLDMSNCGTPLGPQSFIYIENSQKMHFRYINITSKDIYEYPDHPPYQHPNGFGCLFATRGTELIFEDSSIKDYVANGCSALAINPDGDTSLPVGVIKLINCEISGNSAIDADSNPDSVWGCAVNASSGELHLEGKVVIKNNVILKNDGTQESESYNLYVGKYSGATLNFNPIVIDGPLTGSEIWFKLAQEPRVFTSGYSTHETAIPSTYFHSDSGMEVVANTISGEAELSKSFVVYVSSSTSSPAGSNTSGDGTSSKPYASIERAIQKISSFNDSDLEATICVTGNIPCNTIIDDDGSTGTKLVAKNLTIQGTGTSSGGDWKTAAGQAILNGDTDGDNVGNGTILLVSAQKPLTLRNLTLKNGKSTSSGGALCYDGTKTVTIDSCLIHDNEAVDYGGALFFSGSNVSLSYTEITNNKVTGTGSDYGQGGALYLNGGRLNFMSSTSFKSNFAARYGGAISVVNGGLVTMTGGTIECNGALKQGGGVYIGDTASFTMSTSASVIKNNGAFGARITPVTPDTKLCGGGVAVGQGGTFTMNGGEISGNGARGGGGLHVRGTATLNGGTISSNKKTSSAGQDYDLSTRTVSQLSSSVNTMLNNYVYVANVEIGISGTFNMNGGTITQTSDMTKPGQNGVGVNIFASMDEGDSAGNATFNMTEGSITGLSLGQNAAVCLNVSVSGGQAIFNMSGGSIKNNQSASSGSGTGSYGGAIALMSNGHFTMTGGEISGNHASSYGGALYLKDSTSDITLGQSGSESTIIIKDNTAGNSTQLNNIYLPSGEEILIEGPLSSSSQVGVTRNGGFSSDPFTIGFDSSNGTVPADIFTSDAGYSIITDASGEAAFGASGGGLYMPADYNFTLAADIGTVTLGNNATVTITPTVTRTESDGTEPSLYYNPADQKLYLDPGFTQAAGGGNTVSWQASLWCGTDIEQENLAAGTGSNANKFTIAALDFADTYTLRVRATYLGYPHDASFTIEAIQNTP